MYSQRSISLAHRSAMPPSGSPAGEAFAQLQEDGFKITLDPRDDDDLTRQYVQHEIQPGALPIKSDVISTGFYSMWREARPKSHLFAVADHVGRLVCAAWVTPRTAYEVLPDVEASAVGGFSFYDTDVAVAARSLQVTHAYAHRRFTYAHSGILFPVESLPLLPACRALGYKAVSQSTDPNSGIVQIDMVVSSELLEAFNAGPPKRPRLRLINGGKE